MKAERNFRSVSQRTSNIVPKKRKRSQYITSIETSQFALSAKNLKVLGVASSPKLKQIQQAKKDENLSNIIYYNCNKKEYYTNKCLVLPKNRLKN